MVNNFAMEMNRSLMEMDGLIEVCQIADGIDIVLDRSILCYVML